MDEIDWSADALADFERVGSLLRDVSPDFVAACGAGHMAYLATPYSKLCRDRWGNFDRVASINCMHLAAFWQRRFAVRGLTVVSPIVMAGMIYETSLDRHAIDPLDAEFWERWCLPILAKSDLVVVPPIKGWRDSVGVWNEVTHALRGGRRVFLIRDEAS